MTDLQDRGAEVETLWPHERILAAEEHCQCELPRVRGRSRL